MKRKFIVTLVMLVVLVSASVSTVFAAPTSSTYGNVRHNTDYSYYNANYLSNYYYDASGQRAERDKESVVLNFVNGSTMSIANAPNLATYASQIGSQYPKSFLVSTGGNYETLPYNLISNMAPAYRVLGTAGVDAATLSTPDLSKGAESFTNGLKTWAGTYTILPYLSSANVSFDDENYAQIATSYGLGNYTVIGKYGVNVAFFGVISDKKADDLSSVDGITVSDAEKAAEETIEAIKANEDVDIIVGIVDGTDDDGEYSKIAKIDGVDLVVATGKASGDNIVSTATGESASALQVVFEEDGKGYKLGDTATVKLSDYAADSTTSSALLSMLALVNSNYFSKYGYSYSQTLTNNNCDFGELSDISSAKADTSLGNLITDSYLAAASAISGVNADLAVVSSNTINKTLPSGAVTVENVFSMFKSDMDDSTDPGDSLTTVYLTGEEIYRLAEISSDYAKKNSSDGRFFFSGLSYTYNAKRLPGNRVYNVSLTTNGTSKAISKDSLYAVVCDQTTAAEIKNASDKSGIFPGKITLKDKDGNELSEYTALTSSAGQNLKAWQAVSYKLASLGNAGITANYGESDVRINYENTLSPSHIFKEINKVAIALICILVIITIVIIFIILFLAHLFTGKQFMKGDKKTPIPPSSHRKGGIFSSRYSAKKRRKSFDARSNSRNAYRRKRRRRR